MLTYAILINYSMLIGTMIFFVGVVSPSAISTLTGDYLSSFLRAIFPKMFLMGLLFGIIGTTLIYFIHQPLVLLSSGFINLSFLINLLIITPKINALETKNPSMRTFAKESLRFIMDFQFCFLFLTSLYLDLSF